MSTNSFQKRIDYQGDLRLLFDQVCLGYGIGAYVSHEVVLNGYEDFNIILETSKGKYFVKVFAKFRSEEECERYINIIESVLAAGINHPFLYESSRRKMYKTNIDGSDIHLCVLEHVEGETLYDSNIDLAVNEMKFIIQQASIINQIDIKPTFVYDSWAIVNILKEYKEKGKFLDENDAKLIKDVINNFTKLNIADLPHCFVHGDIIKTNVMKDREGKLSIIDFSVSNYYPRIQELAVLLCNLFFDESNDEKSKQNYQLVIDEYCKYINLTDFELEILPLYVKVAHAMHLLSANHEEKALNNNSEENKYWLNLGRVGLQQ